MCTHIASFHSCAALQDRSSTCSGCIPHPHGTTALHHYGILACSTKVCTVVSGMQVGLHVACGCVVVIPSMNDQSSLWAM